MMRQVFVYGTLLPGHLRWPIVAPWVQRWQGASVAGRLWDTGHGYPAARFADPPADAIVHGAVLHLRDGDAARAIAQLDAIEGADYRRIVVTTSAGEAETYEWVRPVDGFMVLDDGRWTGV